MPTLLEHAEALAKAHPTGKIYLPRMAEIFWPGADWLQVKMGRNNGGARKGARLAAGLAGRMNRKGFVRLAVSSEYNDPTCYEVNHKAIEAARAALDKKP